MPKKKSDNAGFEEIVKITAAAEELEQRLSKFLIEQHPGVFDPILKTTPKILVDKSGLLDGQICRNWHDHPFNHMECLEAPSYSNNWMGKHDKPEDLPHIDIRFGGSLCRGTNWSQGIARVFPTYIKGPGPDGHAGRSKFTAFSRSSFEKIVYRSITSIKEWREDFISDREWAIGRRLTDRLHGKMRKHFNVQDHEEDLCTIFLKDQSREDAFHMDQTELTADFQVSVNLKTRTVKPWVDINGSFPADAFTMLMNLFNSDPDKPLFKC